ncbi:MAG: hypothetical protein QF463_14725 [Vicinamibacterales bacterium]|nr:hypothetical protein [Acidobacteriota bacterium]MDP6372019.1 hypothetical protein [Vicinamibacterales bacterium]MDP6610318.1 hypothetical protein [Vicinamibacterales bacterium]HAK55875.1 hypothetical protein [Acidobacteriota bacterium]|tara:strand:+ start:1865 stop:2467 length:603 start_codon:yes stop_codon:yes gene_type:complete
MKRAVWIVALVLGVTALGAGVWAQTSGTSATPWLHVRVMEDGDDSANVNVNLPLTAVEAVVAMMPERVMDRGRIRLSRDQELSVSDLRSVWEAVRATGDGEFVSIERDDRQGRVALSGDVIQIQFEEREDDDSSDDDSSDDRRSVRAEIPVAVVDALLSGDDDVLDLVGALEQLKEIRGDLVRVTNGDERVRVWIDDEQS